MTSPREQRREIVTIIRRLAVVVVVLIVAVGLWLFLQQQRAASIDRLVQRCRQAADRQAWGVLEESANALMSYSDQHVAGLLWLAEAKQQKRDFTQTAMLLEKVPKQDSRWEAVSQELVDLYLGPLNQPLKGQALCEELLLRSPQLWRPRQRLIYVLAMTLQWDRLQQQLSEAIDHPLASPEVFPYFVLGRSLLFSDGIEVTGRWLAANPESEVLAVAAAIHNSKARAETTDKSAEAPEVEVTPIEIPAGIAFCRDKYPSNSEIRNYLLNRGVALGDREQVASLLTGVGTGGASTAQHSDSRLWRFRGWLAAAVEDFSQSERMYQTALVHDPLDWRTRYQLCEVLRSQGKSAEEASQLALMGKLLERKLLGLGSVQQYPPDLLVEMTEYLGKCGMAEAEKSFRTRVKSLGGGGS